MILDTQITGGNHRETILEPGVRDDWFFKIRDALKELDIHGVTVKLAQGLFEVPTGRDYFILPPAVQVSDGEGGKCVIPAPSTFTPHDLGERVKKRNKAVQTNGYLFEDSLMVSPVLVYPEGFSEKRASRMQQDLSRLLKRQDTAIVVGGPEAYKTEDEVVELVQDNTYNCVIAVLPEGSRTPQQSGDTHERLKKKLKVESQCIQHDNTLDKRYLDQPWKVIDKLPWPKKRKAYAARSNYQTILNNLLVKKGLVPFLPAEPFNFNVHVGIDVGGIHNNFVAVCVGYGMATDRPVLLNERLELSDAQVEPIPPDALAKGLLSIFERIANALKDGGQQPDFSSVLFFRDGDLKGQGDAWHESDAFTMIYEGLEAKGLLKGDETWVATEISKRATHLRQFWQSNGRLENPLVGRVTFPYDDENIALVSTTGVPYLPQGTASPLLVQMHTIKGELNRIEVLTDLVWEADMCFTKLDTGMSLPFVLHVADQNALQTSRLYEYSGITV